MATKGKVLVLRVPTSERLDALAHADRTGPTMLRRLRALLVLAAIFSLPAVAVWRLVEAFR